MTEKRTMSGIDRDLYGYVRQAMKTPKVQQISAGTAHPPKPKKRA